MSRRLKIALAVVGAHHPGGVGDDDDSNETAEPQSDDYDPNDYQGGVAPDDVEEGDPLLRTSRRMRTRTRKLRPLSMGSLDSGVLPPAS